MGNKYHQVTYFHILRLKVDVRIVKNVAYKVLDHPTISMNSFQNLHNNRLPKTRRINSFKNILIKINVN